MKSLIILFFVIFCCYQCGGENAFSEGEQAYLSGDYDSAIEIFKPLAEQGHGAAMFYLGRMHEKGRGMKVDFAEAYAWYNVSADLGNEKATENLEQIRGWMRQKDFERGEKRLEEILEEIGNSMRSADADQDESERLSSEYSQSESAAGWSTVNEKSFSIRHPENWRVQGPDVSGKITLTSRDQESLVIWPVFMQQSLSNEGASSLVSRMAKLVDQTVSWQYPYVQGNWVRCSGRSNNRVAMTAMYWLPLRRGTAAFVYALTAPEQVYARNEANYAEILSSFRAREGDGGRSDRKSNRPRFQFVRWQDPAEQAVSFEVPRSWSIRGGLVRRTALDYTFAARLNSPDGQIEIFMGDPNMPPFVLPSQMLQMSGMGEGSWYQMMDGTRALVQRYQTGVQFAGSYVQQAFGRKLSGVQIIQSQDRPDISQYVNQLNQQYGVYGVEAGLSTGEVYFQGSGQAGRRQGYAFAGTYLIQMQDYTGSSGNWLVQHLYGYTAPPERVAEAQSVLRRIIATVQLNPAWARSQGNLTAATVQITTQTSNYISNTISKTWANTQQSQDRSMRKFSNYIRGVEDVIDPATGQRYQVESGSNYYWINNLATKVGSNLGYNPDVTQFRQMIRLDQ
ncbi:MAG: tetratricopeptide repeat protein [bacterium]